jgi:tRNA threonylcarbamoyladenosine biosynthesis protein TsaE
MRVEPSKPEKVATSDERDTELFGEVVGRLLRAGDIVGLAGPLGAGKTVLTRGIARGTGVPAGAPVSSPSFTILNIYEGKDLEVCHLDLYRIASPEELDGLGLSDLLARPAALVVEWYDRFPAALPADVLRMEISETGPTSRLFTLTAQGPDSAELKDRILDAVTGAPSNSEPRP